MRSRTAFTLIELLLVLVLIGVLAAVTASRLAPLRKSSDVNNVAQLLSDRIQECQDLAVQGSQMVRLRVDLDTRSSEIQVLDQAQIQNAKKTVGDNIETLSQSGAMRITFIDELGSEQTSGNVEIVFFPDRQSSTLGTFSIILAEHEKFVACYRSGRPPRIKDVL